MKIILELLGITSKLYVFQNLERLEERKKDGKIHVKNYRPLKIPFQLNQSENNITNDFQSSSILMEGKNEKEKNGIKLTSDTCKEHAADIKTGWQERKNNAIFKKNDDDGNFKIETFQKNVRNEKEPNLKQEKNLENFERFKNGKQKFNFGFMDYIKMKLKFKKTSLKNEEKLFMKSQQQIFFEMDIIHILRKIQEIEKLKKILLNKNEQYLFDLLDKPFIHLEKQELRGETEGIDFKRKSIMVNSFKNLDFKKEQIIENYRKVKNSQSVVGNRLLKLMDQDVFMFVGNEHFEDVKKKPAD